MTFQLTECHFLRIFQDIPGVTLLSRGGIIFQGFLAFSRGSTNPGQNIRYNPHIYAYRDTNKHIRNHLCVVVLVVWTDAGAPVRQEVIHCVSGCGHHADLVNFGPYLNPDQGHINVDRPVELRTHDAVT